MFLSNRERNKIKHTEEGNTVSVKSRSHYLSRRERNRRKHAENGNPKAPAKTADDWETEFVELQNWVTQNQRRPNQRSSYVEERRLAVWIVNVRKRAPLVHGTSIVDRVDALFASPATVSACASFNTTL